MGIEDLKMPICRMADNLYHIGVKGGPCYVLDTSEGIVLIDTALPEALAIILQNLKSIGKNPSDIKHIIHTHGHIDHVGSTKKLVELSGAKTYIGKGDESAVMGENRLICAEELGMRFDDTFIPDVILGDGNTLTVGDTKFRFVSTPGHTAGTMSLFFDVCVDGKKYLAGMFGGAGLNTLTHEYLDRYGLPLSMREQFIHSIDKIMDIPVEFHVGNHLSDNNYHEKVLRLGNKVNPFLADNTYKAFLIKRKAQALELFARDK